MNSRERILAAVRRNKPEASPLPSLHDFAADQSPDELLAAFREVLSKISAETVLCASMAEVAEAIASRHGQAGQVCCMVQGLPVGNVDMAAIADPHQLAGVDVAIVQGHWGVAENGAIWLTERDLGHRALAFIAQHLVIVLPKAHLVANMHQAYERISLGGAGYGAFISGPSRTADIEQSLVVGAHGARSLLVCLV